MRLEKFDLIFWDFDGVIKESVSIKTEAFVELFSSYGEEVCNKIREHQEWSGGMSRFEKIPIYFEWANIKPTRSEINDSLLFFSKIVKNKVINSEWVPGVHDFLRANNKNYIFIMASATPQNELEDICQLLGISKYFIKLYGSPNSKSNAIKSSMLEFNCPAENCLMIGDMQADIDAAKKNKISFILRRHNLNNNLDSKDLFMEITDFKSL